MVKLHEDGSVDLNKSTFQDLVDFYSGYILEQFVTDGGKGLRSGMREAIYSAVEWGRLYDKRKDRSGQSST